MDEELINPSQPPEDHPGDDDLWPNFHLDDDTPRNIFQMFQRFEWSNRLEINEDKGFVKSLETGDFLLQKKRGFFELAFFIFSQDTGSLARRNNSIYLLVDEKLNPLDFIEHWRNASTNNHGYNLRNYRNHATLKRVLGNINTVKISSEYKSDIVRRKNLLLLKPEKFAELESKVQEIDIRTNSSKWSFLVYLTNQLKVEFLNEKIRETTSYHKGDFGFQVRRFNLKTKKKKSDFDKYLSELDNTSLGQLFYEMLRKGIFSKEYITQLDDYLIRESLEDIIKLGQEILKLKSENVKTVEALKVIKQITYQAVGQLEAVWQKYFEKYLLYLFFSYRKILPKVELKNIESGQKSYPDFIGVNHYDGVDVIEIKTHLKDILIWDSSHNNFAFSSEMSKAIIQTINYMDAIADNKFKKTKSKTDLLDFLKIDENLSRPRGIIIISSNDKIYKRRNDLCEDRKRQLQRDFTKLRNSIHNIQIFTFSEILGIASIYAENFDITRIRATDTNTP